MEAKWSLQTSLLVYMALVVRVSSVVLCWERDGSSTWLLSSESLQSSCALVGVAHLWQYVKSHAPLWLMTRDSTHFYCWKGLLGWVFAAVCCRFVHIPMPFPKLFLLSLFVYSWVELLAFWLGTGTKRWVFSVAWCSRFFHNTTSFSKLFPFITFIFRCNWHPIGLAQEYRGESLHSILWIPSHIDTIR